MLSFEQVKKDLRSLKHLEYSIQTFTEAHERLKKQYEAHKNDGLSTEAELKKLLDAINRLNTSEFIRKSIEKKDRYFEAISQLEPMNQTIIIDSVINGVTYWKIGNKLGYSDETIKKRVNKSIKQIVKILNNK
jgi:DNA-directed RNA polymerase specialized sigma24 family protein